LLAAGYRPAHIVVFPQRVEAKGGGGSEFSGVWWLREGSRTWGAQDIADLVTTVATAPDDRIGIPAASDVLVLFTGVGAAGGSEEPSEE